MIDNPNGVEPTLYDPASMATSSLISTKAVWYKRPWFMITFAIVVVVAVSVITDLPHPITTAQNATAQNESIKQINTDIAPCAYAIKEAFSFYNQNQTGQLTASNLAQVPGLLANDEVACSLASGPIYDLTNNIQVLDTTAGKNIDSMLAVVATWIRSDALAAVKDIQYLFAHPGDHAKLKDLTAQQVLLAKDRLIALSYLSNANAVLGVTLHELKLPALPHLVGT